jgi:hypothetical protein
VNFYTLKLKKIQAFRGVVSSSIITIPVRVPCQNTETAEVAEVFLPVRQAGAEERRTSFLRDLCVAFSSDLLCGFCLPETIICFFP